MIATNVVHDKQRMSPSRRISNGWYYRFMQRQNHLTLHKGDPIANIRMDCMNEETMTDYFDKLKYVLQKNKLMDSPSQIYNVDETRMPLDHRPPKIVTKRGQKKVRSRTSSNKSQVTVIACVSATGHVIPPFVIFDAKGLNYEWTRGQVPGTRYGLSSTGWVDTELFKGWLNKHFLKHVVGSRPLLLVLDGHSTHYQPELIKRSGIFPFNPNALDYGANSSSNANVGCSSASNTSVRVEEFTSEQIERFERRFVNNYDIPDPEYVRWLKETHPTGAAQLSSPPLNAIQGDTTLAAMFSLSPEEELIGLEQSTAVEPCHVGELPTVPFDVATIVESCPIDESPTVQDEAFDIAATVEPYHVDASHATQDETTDTSDAREAPQSSLTISATGGSVPGVAPPDHEGEFTYISKYLIHMKRRKEHEEKEQRKAAREQKKKERNEAAKLRAERSEKRKQEAAHKKEEAAKKKEEAARRREAVRSKGRNNEDQASTSISRKRRNNASNSVSNKRLRFIEDDNNSTRHNIVYDDTTTDDYDDNQCCVCFRTYEEDQIEETGFLWVRCVCGRWVHEDCYSEVVMDKNGRELICPYCVL
ncbi:uncharacterized protein [Dysidea avara]|uniref:uncharacterized protein n=1 Tax=Dysidea avara TaxID=196820 RepID=UPI003319B8A2